jgi:hypothetical protein
MMIRWQIFTSQETHAAVQVQAKQLGISPGEFVRRSIDRELARDRGGEYRIVPRPKLEPADSLSSAHGAAPDVPSHEKAELPAAAASAETQS